MRVKKSAKIALLCIALVIGILSLYFFSPYFHFSKAIILGESTMNQSQLMELSAVDYNLNIYRIDLETAQGNIMKSPYIKNAQIKRKFPRTLVFSISERKPAAAVSFSGGFAIIDEEGYVVQIEQSLVNLQKPIISGIHTMVIKLGEKIPVEDEAQFEKALILIEGAQNARLLEIISEINMSDLTNIRMTTINGLGVFLGTGEDLSYKMLLLNEILLDLHSRGIRRGNIDMRYNSYPVYREG